MLQFLVTLQALATDRLHGTDRERGATAVEYGLMVALIAAAIIGVVALLGDELAGMFGDVQGDISDARQP